MRISDWSSDVCSSDLLDGAGCPRLAINRVKAHIGGGGRRMLALSLAEAGRDEAGLDALYERMLAFYADNIAVETHAFDGCLAALDTLARSEEHTSELQSLMRISYAVFCLKKKTLKNNKEYVSTTRQVLEQMHA